VRVDSEVLAAEAAGFELLSVFEARLQGQESVLVHVVAIRKCRINAALPISCSVCPAFQRRHTVSGRVIQYVIDDDTLEDCFDFTSSH
jgi:hypothetical protein